MFDKTVKDLRPYEAATLVPEDGDVLVSARRFIDNPDLHHLCVVDEAGRLLGLINRKRLFTSIFSHQVAADSRVSKLLTLHTAETTADIMFTHILSVRENDKVEQAIRAMIKHNIKEMPALDEKGTVIGFLTILMLMREWLRGQEKTTIRDQ